MYEYRGSLREVVDGDTIDVLMDLGFRIYHLVPLRLNGLNTPEKNTPAGQHAKKFVEDWFSTNGSNFTVYTNKDRTEKYGRYLATVVADNGKSLVADIINAGLGVFWDGKGQRPLPPSPPEQKQ